ncbi:hypothetical protein Pan241w_57270 [Gimesia alba]|uniref:Uncharacterized protein n=1 Tax=Gimesia alba TaxID=2527973 RepID=A0A517RNY1_9PLAN|nr:hypothetical protein Pan241w_57270 [Gimesia alba]
MSLCKVNSDGNLLSLSHMLIQKNINFLHVRLCGLFASFSDLTLKSLKSVINFSQ